MIGSMLNGLHHHLRPAQNGAPMLVFANSLGTDFRLWDRVVARLPAEWGTLRLDKRGHGLSDFTGPHDIDALAGDIETLLDHYAITRFTGIGLSVGGMVMQRLALRRAGAMQAVMLADTGARIGNTPLWNERIEAVMAGGVAAISEAILARWFPPAYHATPDFALWRNMLERTAREGYAAVSAAIRDADFTQDLPRIAMPTLTICGAQDGSTPPEMMRQMTARIPNARFVLVENAGHLPCVDQPDIFTAALRDLVGA